MGGNQSSIPEQDSGSFEPLDGIGSPAGHDGLASQPPTSVTPSGGKSRFSFQHLPRSLSTSMHSPNGSSEPAGHQLAFMSRLNSRSTTSLASDSHQASSGAGNSSWTVSPQGHRQHTRPGGIVVVNKGGQRAQSYSDVSSLSRHEGAARPPVELCRRLRRLPLFEPLIPRSEANVNSLRNTLPMGSTTDKRVPPFQHNFDSQELTEITTCYANYLRQTVTRVGQQQAEIVGLQNKVDYDVRRLSALLAARVQGTPPPSRFQVPDRGNMRTSLGTEKAGAPVLSNSQHRLAGARQVDSVVLQTSQLSSLLTQCTLMTQELFQSINDLNDSLPEGQRLAGWPSNTESRGLMDI